MEQVLATVHQVNHARVPLCLSLEGSARHATLALEAPSSLASFFSHQLLSAYPDCQLLPDVEKKPSGDVMNWRTSLHLADFWPIKRHPEFVDALNRTTADPLASLLLALHQIAKQGLRPSLQFIIRPAKERRVRHQERLHVRAKKVAAAGDQWLHWYSAWATSRYSFSRFVAWLVTYGFRKKSVHELEPTDREAWADAADKLRRQLYETNVFLRIEGNVNEKTQARRILEALAGSLGSLSSLSWILYPSWRTSPLTGTAQAPPRIPAFR